MPEGHTIHRLAQDHRRWLLGEALAVASPQGRFAEGAEVLHRTVLDAVDAWGKHLFYTFSGGHTLHVHLGLYGRFRARRLPTTPWRSPPRLVLTGAEREVRLSGPTACELLDEAGVTRVCARLGPDPLRDDGRLEDVLDAVPRRTRAVGALLLDQSFIAGIGNVYRAELLFLLGIHPATPAGALRPEQWAELWERGRALLEVGVRLNRIVTVDPAEQGKQTARQLTRHERLHVYRRQRCRRCGDRIRTVSLAARPAYFCPTCQPAAAP